MPKSDEPFQIELVATTHEKIIVDKNSNATHFLPISELCTRVKVKVVVEIELFGIPTALHDIHDAKNGKSEKEKSGEDTRLCINLCINGFKKWKKITPTSTILLPTPAVL